MFWSFICVGHSYVVCVHSNRNVLHVCCSCCVCCDMVYGMCICMCAVGVIGDIMSECVYISFVSLLWLCG